MKYPPNLKEAVKDFLTEGELKIFRRAFDTVGDIAVLEIPEELEAKEKKIAQTLLDVNKTIKVVVKKVGGHTGTFRIQKFKILAGERRKTTIHKENGVRIKLHIEEAYFSPRLSTERLRIAQLTKSGENVLAMFCGVAPYVCVIAKQSEAKEVWGIEINPNGHKWGLENIKFNKVQERSKLFCGDVRDVVPTLNKTFDRITMPLPKTGEEFLPTAMQAAAKGATIHYYAFLPEEQIQTAEEHIKKACEATGRTYESCTIIKCGQQSPRVYRICADVKLSN